jgi:hypothetical protein
MAGNEAEVAEHLIELVKIGRGVLSEQMKNINDPTKADKGFTGDYMAGQVVERFKKETKLDLRIPNVVPQANLYLALVQAEKEVVDEAQPVINKPGISFKGFIPAVFTRRVGEQFYKKSGVRVKLTGIDYRNPNNKPDDFETEVLRMSQGTVLCAEYDGGRTICPSYDGPGIRRPDLPQLSWFTERRARCDRHEERGMERRGVGRGDQHCAAAEIAQQG